MSFTERKKWYSHKFKGFAIKYEIASSIHTGHIVHYSGPYRGAVHDLTIFRFCMRKCLNRGEKAIGDRGYRGDRKLVTTYTANDAQHARAIKLIGARHETINGRICTFESMRQRWRHALDKHHIAFRAVLVLVQISIANGRPVFSVRGYEDPLHRDDVSVDSVTYEDICK